MVGMSQNHSNVRDEAQNKKKHPTECGIITNLDDVEKVHFFPFPILVSHAVPTEAKHMSRIERS